MGLGGVVSFHVLGKLCEFYSFYCPKQKRIATFKTLNEKLILRKFLKIFLVSLNARCSLYSVLSGPLYVERDTFCRTWGYGVSLFSNTSDWSSTEKK